MKYPLTKFAQKCSDGWIDRCPAHDDNNPSLSIKETSDGKLLLHCFAGCSFEDIVKAADIATHSQNCSNTYKPVYDETTAALKLSKRISKAESIWKETIPLDGTLAQTYLNSRDIECWSDDIRFHPNLYFSQTKSDMPAMVCAIRRNGQFVGIHRTYLDADGNKLNKMMLGDCKGGSVYLGGAGDPITISEGIENGLSCRQMLTSKIGTFLAAMSASNLGNFKLPSKPTTLIIAADDDHIGKVEAFKLGQRAASLGWRASTLMAPPPGDWNDYLKRGD